MPNGYLISPLLGLYQKEASIDAMVKPAEEEGGSYEQGALDLIFNKTNGYPYFLAIRN